MSLRTGDLWRSALWLNLSLKSLRLLEITDCRQLINQLVGNFGNRQARLCVSKFFEPNLRSPKKDSNASGTNWIPISAHFWAHFSCLLSSLFVRAKAHLLAASEIRLGCSGEVMVTYNAAGCPADQLGKYMSPGFEFSSGIKFFCSRTGAKFTVEKTASFLSLRLWCHDIMSPRQ